MRVLCFTPSLTRSIGAGILAAAVVAGCGSSAGAGWTYVPQPSITPPPSASASPSASPSQSAQPSGPGGSGSFTNGPIVKVVASGVAFTTAQLEAPAGQPFGIDFDNQDLGIPHNIEIKDPAGASVFKGAIVTGPVVTNYRVTALAAGTYSFLCDVHPTTMTGTLTVK